MNAAMKIGFAILLAAVLFFRPIGSCAASVKAPDASADPCCPAKRPPAQDNCFRPNCICLNTRSVPTVAAPADGGAPVQLAAVSEAASKCLVAVMAAPQVSLVHAAARHRFLTFHQFLI
jgi:hypothetical protein